MEIELMQLSKVQSQSTTNEKKMRLSENASLMVFQLFTKNVYSNPIGTIVREITSNCFDSHIEAGVDAPVLIKKFVDRATDNQYISFIDYGVGMSPDRIENVYGVYFESTKRTDNTQIGGFGIGGKTPLAYIRSTGIGEAEYDNSFYVITIYNGIKYMYCIYEGAESPIISLMHQENTKERNGTEIRIPVLERDVSKFVQEMTRQLYYFENIIFEGFDNEKLNDYQIVRGKSFWFRGQDYSNNMHICLGRVAYPIDFSALGLNSYDYNIPVAIKLEVGDINVTVSRESLDYSETTISLLKKKIEEVKTELIDRLVAQYSNIVTLEDYFNVKKKFGYLHLTKDKSVYLNDVIKQSEIDFTNFRYNFMKIPNDSRLFDFFFNVKYYGKKQSRRYRDNTLGYDNLNQKNIFYIEGEFNRKVLKQGYLNHTYDTFRIISKKEINKYRKEDIAYLFKVQIDDIVDSKGSVLPFIQSLIEMQEEFMGIVRKNCTDYDEFEVPEDFIEFRKQRSNKSIINLSIPARINGSRYNILLKNLFKYNGVIFYGFSVDSEKLNNDRMLFTRLFPDVSPIHGYGRYVNDGSSIHNFNGSGKDLKTAMFIQIAKNNEKYMKFCKKAHHISEFYDKMLKRKKNDVINYFKSQGVIDRFSNINTLYKRSDFDKINPSWGKVINNVLKQVDILNKSRILDISYYEDSLSKYFDLKNLKDNASIRKLNKQLDGLESLETLNEETLNYININRYTELNPTIIEILKKVMVF